MALDAVRAGSALIGRLPLKENFGLQRVGYLKCDIENIRTLPPKHNIGYSNLYKSKCEMKIGVANAGYADGISCARSNPPLSFKDCLRYVFRDIKRYLKRTKTYCQVGDKKAPVLGLVCMSNTIIDLRGIDCSPGDFARFDNIIPFLVDSSIKREYI